MWSDAREGGPQALGSGPDEVTCENPRENRVLTCGERPHLLRDDTIDELVCLRHHAVDEEESLRVRVLDRTRQISPVLEYSASLPIPSAGIEPALRDPESRVLSVEL